MAKRYLLSERPSY